jgi:hypothetical protein
MSLTLCGFRCDIHEDSGFESNVELSNDGEGLIKGRRGIRTSKEKAVRYLRDRTIYQRRYNAG